MVPFVVRQLDRAAVLRGGCHDDSLRDQVRVNVVVVEPRAETVTSTFVVAVAEGREVPAGDGAGGAAPDGDRAGRAQDEAVPPDA